MEDMTNEEGSTARFVYKSVQGPISQKPAVIQPFKVTKKKKKKDKDDKKKG